MEMTSRGETNEILKETIAPAIFRFFSHRRNRAPALAECVHRPPQLPSPVSAVPPLYDFLYLKYRHGPC